MGLEIILHVGRHKSGTSSLQAYLHQRADACSAERILYPRAGRTVLCNGQPVTQVAHHALAQSFLDADRRAAGARQRQWLEELRTELHGHDRLIFSSEAFGNLVQPHQIEGVRAFLNALQPERITVVAYLREYLDYINSGYRQRVQSSGDLVALAEYPLLRYHRYSLAAWLAAWRSVGDLRCRRFAREILHQGDVVADFCLQAGLHYQAGVVPEDRNPSIGGNLLFLKCSLNHLGRRHPDLYGLLGAQAALQSAYRRPLAISDAAASRIREQNDWNRTLQGLFGPVPLPSFDQLPSCPEPSALQADLESWQPLLQLTGTRPEEIEALIGAAAAWFEPFPDHG